MSNRRMLNWLLASALLLSPIFASQSSSTEGSVMGVGSASLFILSDGGEQIEFAVPASTRITRDGDQIKLDELQPRDQVVVVTGSRPDGDSAAVATEIVARTPY